MKLYATFLLLATITARTMAQAEDTTLATTIESNVETTPYTKAEPTTAEPTTAEPPTAEPTTDGPTTVPPVGETTVDSTVPTSTPTTDETTAAPNITNVNPLQCYSCADEDCNEKVVVRCSENGKAPVTLAFLRRDYRAAATNIKGYACYSIKVTVNDSQRDKLGCIGIPEGESACEAVRKELQLTTDDSSDECKACQEDACNGSMTTRLSVVTLLCLILTKFFI